MRPMIIAGAITLFICGGTIAPALFDGDRPDINTNTVTSSSQDADRQALAEGVRITDRCTAVILVHGENVGVSDNPKWADIMDTLIENAEDVMDRPFDREGASVQAARAERPESIEAEYDSCTKRIIEISEQVNN